MATGVYSDELASISIEDGIVTLTWPNGEQRCTPLRIFRIFYARAGLALASYDARLAEVHPIKGRKRGDPPGHRSPH